MKTLAQLESEVAKHRDPHEAQRVSDEQIAKQWAASANLARARGATADLAILKTRLEDDTKWLAFLTTSHDTLSEQLLALPPGDRRQLGLELSLRLIDYGIDYTTEGVPAQIPMDGLLIAAGYQPADTTLADSCGKYWRGSRPAVKERLADLRRRQRDAEETLASALR